MILKGSINNTLKVLFHFVAVIEFIASVLLGSLISFGFTVFLTIYLGGCYIDYRNEGNMYGFERLLCGH